MELKEQVREKYGQAALRVHSGGSSCCGSRAEFRGLRRPDHIQPLRFRANQRDAARRGAGVARLRESYGTGRAEARETVLDLGSGGGIDVLLSRQARRARREKLMAWI